MTANVTSAKARTSDEVQELRWPAQEAARQRLADAGRPRLLILTRTCAPPQEWDELEDWVRDGTSATDVEHRKATLAERARPKA